VVGRLSESLITPFEPGPRTGALVLAYTLAAAVVSAAYLRWEKGVTARAAIFSTVS
jgi:hypothetical protein